MFDELVNELRDGGAFEICGAYDILERAADAIEELTDRNVGKWIPVTERLPRAERESYWVCTDTGYQCEARWTNNVYGFVKSNNHEWGWSIADIPQYRKVTHWMPLPQPPKEE